MVEQARQETDQMALWRDGVLQEISSLSGVIESLVAPVLQPSVAAPPASVMPQVSVAPRPVAQPVAAPQVSVAAPISVAPQVTAPPVSFAPPPQVVRQPPSQPAPVGATAPVGPYLVEAFMPGSPVVPVSGAVQSVPASAAPASPVIPATSAAPFPIFKPADDPAASPTDLLNALFTSAPQAPAVPRPATTFSASSGQPGAVTPGSAPSWPDLLLPDTSVLDTDSQPDGIEMPNLPPSFAEFLANWPAEPVNQPSDVLPTETINTKE